MTTTTKAKRGDYAVCVKSSYVMVNKGKGHTSESFTLGVVVSVTRDGKAKRVKPLHNGCDLHPRDWKTIHIIDRTWIGEVEAFETHCKRRQCTSRENWEPFTSLDDVRRTVRAFSSSELVNT